MISNARPDCATSECRQSARQASSLRAGIITDTVGRWAFVSIAAIIYQSAVESIIIAMSPAQLSSQLSPAMHSVPQAGRALLDRTTEGGCPHRNLSLLFFY